MFIQLLEDVPDWMRERGIDARLLDILEQIQANPKKEDEILASAEYGDRCCLASALEYGRSKGLLN